jgi:hypothetical protein
MLSDDIANKVRGENKETKHENSICRHLIWEKYEKEIEKTINKWELT